MSLIEFHILRNYAPSNLNRDDVGAPKTAVFAGVQRGRISSQCLKRSWRSSNAFSSLNSLGIRTQYLSELVLEKLKEYGDFDTINFYQKNKKVLATLGQSKDKKGKDKNEDEDDPKLSKTLQLMFFKNENEANSQPLKTLQLMFFSDEDINACAQAVIAANKDLNRLEDNIKQLNKSAPIRPISLDIALFGRMVTDDKFADVEASLQVAHALSTNRVNQESDYFTAVDDMAAAFRDDAGAGHLGDSDFNSCCYYEYASLDVEQLKRNLKNSPNALAKLNNLIEALVDAMIYTSPSGKQNSFAAHSLPSIFCIEKKSKNIATSYINAFEKPVSCDYSTESAKRLVQQIDKTDKKYDTSVESRLWFDANDIIAPENAKVVTSIGELKKIAAEWLA